jgi:triphosphoribosyl-dephospho-CoA synthetase
VRNKAVKIKRITRIKRVVNGTFIKQLRGHWLLLVLLSMLHACTTPVGFATSEVAQEQDILAYYDWIRSASPEAVALEQQKLSTSNNVNPIQRNIKRALLMSVPSQATLSAMAEAERLLQQTLSDASVEPDKKSQPVATLAADYQLFAKQWLDVLQLRKQLLQLTQELSLSQASLQDIQATQADLLQRYNLLSATLMTQQQQREALQQRNTVLQQQLDALKGLEHQLVEQQEQTSNGTAR